MSKWVYDEGSGELDYPTLGFRAAPGDILDATAAPDGRWSLNGDQGAAETVTRYTIGGDPSYVEPGDGHFLVWSDADNSYVPAAPETVYGSEAVQNLLQASYVVLGPTPNGTDDTAAINAAVAALPPGATLQLRKGTYKAPNGGLTISTLGRIRGAGSLSSSAAGGTVIEAATPANDVLTVDSAAAGSVVEDVMFRNTSPLGTTKAAIRSSANWLRLRNVSASGFYINFDIDAGYGGTMTDCVSYGSLKYGARFANTAIADAGDWAVTGCTFIASGSDSDAAIYQTTGGGLKIVNTKINSATGAGVGPKFLYGVLLEVGASTSDLLIANSSIENTRGSGLKALQLGSSTANFYNIVLTGVQFALYQSDLAVNYVDITPANGTRPFQNITIAGCSFLAPVGQTGAAIRLSNITNADISAGNTYLNFPASGEVVLANACAHVRTAQPQEIWLDATDFGIAFGTPTLGAQRRHPAWLMTFSELVAATIGPGRLNGWRSFDVILYWTNNGAGSGNVSWRFDYEFKDDTDTLTDAGTTTSIVTVAAPAVDVVKKTTLTTFVSVTAGKPLNVRIWRQTSGDTLGNDAALLGVMIRKAN